MLQTFKPFFQMPQVLQIHSSSFHARLAFYHFVDVENTCLAHMVAHLSYCRIFYRLRSISHTKIFAILYYNNEFYKSIAYWLSRLGENHISMVRRLSKIL